MSARSSSWAAQARSLPRSEIRPIHQGAMMMARTVMRINPAAMPMARREGVSQALKPMKTPMKEMAMPMATSR